MAITLKKVFLAALALMAEDAENAGDYEAHAAPLCNLMALELNDVNNSRRLARGEHESEAPEFESLDDEVPFDREIAMGVLPYGLAAKLALDDDAGKAAYLGSEYMERKAQYGKAVWVGAGGSVCSVGDDYE